MGEGRVDLGITGGDQVAEHEANSPATEESGVVEVLDLGFGRCKLQVQVPEKGEIKDARGLVGKNVVTSFVGLTEGYFAKLEGLGREDVNGDTDSERTEVENGSRKGEMSVRSRLRTKIKYVGGSVEAACALGVADGIVDLVGNVLLPPVPGETLLITSLESGETMKAAGLKAIDTVVESTAVLIKSKHPSNPTLVDLITERIKGVIGIIPLPLSFPVGNSPLIPRSPQPHRNMSFAYTTSPGASWKKPQISHPGNGHLRSKHWTIRSGRLLVLWCRKRE